MLNLVTRSPLLLPVLLFALLLPSAGAEGLYRLPDDIATVSGGAISVTSPAFTDSYVPGIGWLSGADLAAPEVQDGVVYAPEELLRALGLAGAAAVGRPTPRLAEVRFGGTGDVRVVLDLQGLEPGALAGLEREGELAEGEPLRLRLPALLLPDEPTEPYRGVEVELEGRAGATELTLRGPAARYRVFALEEPTRLVLDVLPQRRSEVVPRVETLHPGVVYRRFAAPSAAGESAVHVLEIAPGSGEFRVVGTSQVPRTLSQLASGAFAAINAGYFDTRTFHAIGLLRVDYGLQSLPSRNRASIAFGLGGPVVGRVEADLKARIDGRLYHDPAHAGGEVQVVTGDGAWAGSPRQGVIVARSGRVIANTVGPREVPPGGFAVVYPADERTLAAVDPGARASVEVDFAPDAFDRARYAVEAGPLLVEDGRPAFEPERESFERGLRILDALTQQSAIGVRADGTVLFVVAETMRAEDLVPLMLDLGAVDAMRLDSGGSAGLYAGGQMLSGGAYQRKIVSAIVFRPRGH